MINEEYNNCFACGKDNPIGLHLDFKKEGDLSQAKFVLSKNYEGYPEIIHGGIVTTILDEAMAKVLLLNGIVAYTGKIEVKFRKSLRPEQPYTVFGKISKSKGRVHETSAWIVNSTGEIMASATAVFLEPKKSVNYR